jgi:uncharacterized protein (UPF0548 family)
MLFLRRPSEVSIGALLDRSRGGDFSYPEVGATRDLAGRSGAPRGYNVDHNRARIGHGAAAFDRAVAALRRWEGFRLGWVDLCNPDAPIEVGTAVGILVHVLGVWSLNVNRIVYTLDERAGGVRRAGFAYGTLEEHAERGEERFTIEHHEADDGVYYEIIAFSRPNQAFAKAAYPLTRALQRRFAAGSLRAMQLA